MSNLVRWLFENTKNSKRIAISFGLEEMTYKKLYESIIGTSKMIHNLAGEEENIILVADNSPFFIISYFSIIASGNICIPLKYDKNLNLEKIRAKTNSKNVFIQEKYLGITNDSKFANIFSEKNIEEKEKEFYQIKEYSKEKLAVIIFTSGSTGEPKGVMLTHGNIISNTRSIVKGLNITKNDNVMTVLPFYYCFGASLLHTHIRAGGTLTLNNKILFPQKILQEMIDKKCTGIAGVPTVFQMLLRRTKMKETVFPYMRCVQQAGGKLADPYLKELIAIFGKEKIFVMYGQTEATSRLSILDPKYLDTKLGSVGKGLEETELKVLDKEGVPSKIGETGEIYAIGGNVMRGYYKNKEETKKYLINDILKTGDLGVMDKDGFIFIKGRNKDFIKSRGYRVSGQRIEKIIAEILEIVEVAVIGIEDRLLGEKIIAYVSTNKEISREYIKNYCTSRLQSYEIPSEIVFLDTLPKNKSLKIDYTKLKKEDILKLK